MAVLSSPHESVEYPDRFIYVATTLLHTRPFDALQVELLHYCQTPISLQALSAQMRLSPATVVWLLSPLVQHGMIHRLPLSLLATEEEPPQEPFQPSHSRSPLYRLIRHIKQAYYHWSDRVWFGCSLETREEAER